MLPLLLGIYLELVTVLVIVEFTLGWRWIRFTCEQYTFSMRTSFANQIPIIRHTQKCMITNYVIEHKARNI